MRKKVILITGASGEIGRALVDNLSGNNGNELITLDLQDLPDEQDSITVSGRNRIQK